MAKKKGGGKKKKGGKKAKEPVDPAILQRAMANMPTTTSWGTPLPPAGARDMTPRGAGREEAGMPPLPKFVVRVNELVQLKFTTNPAGLVDHLRSLPVETLQLNAVNEHGWTALMRAARDGMKNHVYALLEAKPTAAFGPDGETPLRLDAKVKSLVDVVEKDGTIFPAGSTALDIASKHHASLKAEAAEKTAFNYKEIKERLQAYMIEQDAGDEDGDGGMPSFPSMTQKPSYHLVEQVKVTGPYYYEE